MRELLRGWRRKTGLGILLVCAVLVIGWMRSLVVLDDVEFHKSMTTHRFRSKHACLSWSRFSPDFPGRALFRRSTADISEWVPVDDWEVEDPERIWMLRFCGFTFGSVWGGQFNEHIGEELIVHRTRVDFWVVPYAAIVLPPTLIAAWLILWKPRTKKLATPAIP